MQLEEGTGWEKPDKAAEVCIAFEAKLNDKVDSLRQIQSNAPLIHRSPLHTTDIQLHSGVQPLQTVDYRRPSEMWAVAKH